MIGGGVFRVSVRRSRRIGARRLCRGSRRRGNDEDVAAEDADEGETLFAEGEFVDIFEDDGEGLRTRYRGGRRLGRCRGLEGGRLVRGS